MNFTLLRLLLALTVLFYHYHALTGYVGWGHGLSATVAVQAFFVVSGWIVTASFESSRSTAAFYVRRMARLYPLYAVVVIVQAAFVVAWAGAQPNLAAELLHYLAANLSFANFLKPTLLGFLDGARVAAINPSLWTLKIEVLFYLSVPLWVALVRRYGWRALLGLFVASTLCCYAAAPAHAGLANQLPAQLRFFVAGMVCRAFFAGGAPVPAAQRALLAAAGVAGLVLAHIFDSSDAMAALQPVFVAAFVVAAACLLPVLRKLPDLSYGVYLLHAPLIQFSHQTGWLVPGPQGLTVVFALTLGLSLIAHYLIEQPAIRAGQRWSSTLSNRPRALPPEPAPRRLHEAQ